MVHDIDVINEKDPVTKICLRMPFVLDWIEYKGETFVAQINYDATKKARKPMMDMYYCMTQCFNDMVLFTTQFDKNKFKPSPFGNYWDK